MLFLAVTLLLSGMQWGEQHLSQSCCGGMKLTASATHSRDTIPSEFRVTVANIGNTDVVVTKDILRYTYTTQVFRGRKWRTIKEVAFGRGVASTGASAPSQMCDSSCLLGRVLLKRGEGFYLTTSVDPNVFRSEGERRLEPGRYRIVFEFPIETEKGSCWLRARPQEFVVRKIGAARK